MRVGRGCNESKDSLVMIRRGNDDGEGNNAPDGQQELMKSRIGVLPYKNSLVNNIHDQYGAGERNIRRARTRHYDNR